jgi:hypothetical protein
MNCQQAAEFVSALFDGERIPRDAAEHIGACAVCCAGMGDYAVMGAELRREASLFAEEKSDGELILATWRKTERARPLWYTNWRTTMRIPRFAFGLMVILLLVLSTGLILTRAKTRDRWFQYKLSGRDGKSIVTATVPTNPNGDPYYDVEAGMNYPEGTVWFHIHVLEQAGETEKIVARTLWIPRGDHSGDAVERLRRMPDREFVCYQGKSLKIPVEGYGNLELNGQLKAVLPENVRNGLYPEDEKLRFIPPVVLIRANQVLSKGDFGGGELTLADSYFAFGTQDDGWYVFSAKPIDGAAEGTITMNQIEFTMEGKKHFLLAGQPIASGSVKVWVKRFQSIGEADASSGWANLPEKSQAGNLAFGALKNLVRK